VLESPAPLPVAVPFEGRIARTTPDPAHDALEKLSLEDVARIVAMFAGALTSQQTQVLVMRYWHDRTFEEIGELVGISLGAAYRIHRAALESLRKRMELAGIRRVADVI
jgi:RNA polymerase sigma factor (sigma-70 family)